MKKSDAGLSLVEMVVVLAILTVLAGLTIPVLENFRVEDGKQKQKQQFEELQKALELWTADELLTKNKVDLTTLVSFGVLSPAADPSAGPAVSYVSMWFADEVSPDGKGLKDAWGKYLDFATTETPPVIRSYGPNLANDPYDGLGAPTDDLILTMSDSSARQKAIEQRTETLNSLLSIYNSNYNSLIVSHPTLNEPSEWLDYDSGGITAKADLITAGLLNEDPFWENKTDEGEVLLKFQPEETAVKYFLRVVSPWER